MECANYKSVYVKKEKCGILTIYAKKSSNAQTGDQYLCGY